MAKVNFGRALQKIYDGLEEYAETYRDEYDSEIGDDGVLGDEWEKIASGLIGLLNGETGNVDPGNMDGDVRDLAKDVGLESDDL